MCQILSYCLLALNSPFSTPLCAAGPGTLQTTFPLCQCLHAWLSIRAPREVYKTARKEGICFLLSASCMTSICCVWLHHLTWPSLEPSKEAVAALSSQFCDLLGPPAGPQQSKSKPSSLLSPEPGPANPLKQLPRGAGQRQLRASRALDRSLRPAGHSWQPSYHRSL